jgi:hypothetical protein
VQAKHRLWRRVLQRAFLDHHLGAAFFAFGRHLFGRLEDEFHAAAQLLAQAREHGGHAQQDRGVAIVAAGVHHAHL